MSRARLRHQRAPKRQHLPLAAGERAGFLLATLAQARKARVHLVERAHCIAVAPNAREGTEGQVVLDLHRSEQLALFRHEHETFRDALLDRQAIDRVPCVSDGAAARQRAHDRTEQRRLALRRSGPMTVTMLPSSTSSDTGARPRLCRRRRRRSRTSIKTHATPPR
jgi:hypothetical protein